MTHSFKDYYIHGALVWSVVCAIISLGATSAAFARVEGCEMKGFPNDTVLENSLSQWILEQQYDNNEFSSFGAIRRHHTAGFVGGDGTKYFYVVPYNANLALWGVLSTGNESYYPMVERYASWYSNHINQSIDLPAGVILDWWVSTDGSIETTCPPGIGTAKCSKCDSEDAYAGTFLGMLATYVTSSGGRGRDFIKNDEMRWKTTLEAIANVMLTLQEDDGLCWAKESYLAKYVMDNSEVAWGLRAMSYLELEVFGDASMSELYGQAFGRVIQGLNSGYNSHTGLWNAEQGYYYVAKHANNVRTGGEFGTWYPDTTCQVWPQLYLTFTPLEHESPTVTNMLALQLLNVSAAAHRAKELVQLVSHHFPSWPNHLVGDFTWPSIGQAALQAGYCQVARDHVMMITALKYPTFPYPWTVTDAGWVLRTLAGLNSLPPPSPSAVPLASPKPEPVASAAIETCPWQYVVWMGLALVALVSF